MTDNASNKLPLHSFSLLWHHHIQLSHGLRDLVVCHALAVLFATWCTVLQASTTDNPPVYLLGGNIVPIGVTGTNTTTAARTGMPSRTCQVERLL